MICTDNLFPSKHYSETSAPTDGPHVVHRPLYMHVCSVIWKVWPRGSTDMNSSTYMYKNALPVVISCTYYIQVLLTALCCSI